MERNKGDRHKLGKDYHDMTFNEKKDMKLMNSGNRV